MTDKLWQKGHLRAISEVKIAFRRKKLDISKPALEKCKVTQISREGVKYLMCKGGVRHLWAAAFRELTSDKVWAERCMVQGSFSFSNVD